MVGNPFAKTVRVWLQQPGNKCQNQNTCKNILENLQIDNGNLQANMGQMKVNKKNKTNVIPSLWVEWATMPWLEEAPLYWMGELWLNGDGGEGV